MSLVFSLDTTNPDYWQLKTTNQFTFSSEEAAPSSPIPRDVHNWLRETINHARLDSGSNTTSVEDNVRSDGRLELRQTLFKFFRLFKLRIFSFKPIFRPKLSLKYEYLRWPEEWKAIMQSRIYLGAGLTDARFWNFQPKHCWICKINHQSSKGPK